MYIAAMGRPIQSDWFIIEWMTYADLSQADLMRETGWSRRKASELVTGAQRYNRDTLNEAAAAFKIRPYELLMHPDEAHAVRRMRAEAIKLAADAQALLTDHESERVKNGTDG